jgi:hypothetical protein
MLRKPSSGRYPRAVGPRTSFLLSGVWAFALAITEAHAAEVSLEAPSDCERAENLRDQIERLIGKPLDGVLGADFAVEVVHSGVNAWSATVQVAPRGGAEEPSARTITGQSCAEVTAAAAVSIAMAIEQDREASDTERASLPPGESPKTSPAETKPLAPTRERRPKAPADSASGSTFHLAFALSGLLDAGALPGPAPGAELHVRAGISGFYGVVFGSLLAPRTAELEDGRGGEFRLASGGLLACGERLLGGFRGRACAGFEGGWMSAEGVRVAEPRTEGGVYRALRAELGLGLPLGARMSLLARGALLAPLAPPRFVLNGTERVHQASAFGGRALLGLELEI